jgi:hypothetical protein
VRQDRTRRIDGAHAFRRVRHVFDDDSRKPWAVAVVVRAVDERRATAPRAGRSSSRSCVRADGRVEHGLSLAVQLGQSLSKVFGVNLLVGGIFEAHLPSMRGARRGRNEEELAGVGEGEVLIPGMNGSGLAKVDLAAITQEGLAVK